MKINNEYVNTNNYAENFFVEELSVGNSENSVVPKNGEGVVISKGENFETTELYNRFGGQNSDQKLLEESGMSTDEEDEAVTVLERIQIQLMTYCDDYNAVGLNIDKSKMQKVLGSTALAESVAKASDLSKYNDNTKEYMLKNNLEPTVDNVYMAIHSSGKKEVSDITDTSVVNAVTDKLTKEGYELSEENKKNAMWLVARGIELTSDNMTKLSALNQIDELMSGDEQAMLTLTTNIAYSLYAGQTSGNAYITDKYFNLSDVEEVIETINNVTDEDIAYVSSNNLPLNVSSLMNAKNQDKHSVSIESYTSVQTIQFRQTIYEARLVMTQESVYNLKRLGVNIKYEDLAQMTEDIKSQRNKLLDTLLNITENETDSIETELFNNTYNMMTSFSALPNAVIGQIYTQEISFTVTEVYSSGMALKSGYEAALTSYETLGTEVRRDLGDSYAKAFSNVDSILEDIGMDINGANQRAVRILGYNSIEISVESVTSVREIASELDYLIDNMTPKTAMHLIKNGINPLEDNIRDVNANLERINEEIGKDEENMGKFLWNLEKKGEVSAQEKDDYIELYRILNMISKNDGNVIGRVLNNGQELTLKNLYSAYKSKKAGDFDYSVSDDYAVTYAKRSLTKFMENAGALTEIMENGEPADMSLEAMLDIASKETSDYEAEAKKYEDIINLTSTELDSIVRNLDSQSVTNIAAYMNMTNTKEFQKKLEKYRDVDEVVEEISAELENGENIEELDKKYEKLAKLGENISNEVKNQTDISYEKLQGALLMRDTLRLMAGNAKRNSYFIPMDIAGEITNIHLTIKNGEAELNNVSISMENEVLGRISSVFTVRSNTVEGHIAVDKEETASMISKNVKVFSTSVSSLGIAVGEIKITETMEMASAFYTASSDENIGTNTYYSVAKAFIGMIKVSTEVK